VDHVEEAVILLLVLVMRDVRNCVRCLMGMVLVEAGQRFAERILARRGSDQALLLREADRVTAPDAMKPVAG
jgi:hypothetical protein